MDVAALLEPRHEFVQQAALADPGRATIVAMPARRLSSSSAQADDRQLGLPSYERVPTAASQRLRPEPRPLPRPPPPRSCLRLHGLRLVELERAFRGEVGRVADQDPVLRCSRSIRAAVLRTCPAADHSPSLGGRRASPAPRPCGSRRGCGDRATRLRRSAPRSRHARRGLPESHAQDRPRNAFGDPKSASTASPLNFSNVPP